MDTIGTTPIPRINSSPIDPVPANYTNPKITEVTTSWESITSRLTQIAESGFRQPKDPVKHMQHLSGLLQLQVDVSRYQFRVELVSKVSESAVASVRKLQQNQ